MDRPDPAVGPMLDRLFVKICLFELAVLAVFIVSAGALTGYFKGRLAARLTEAFRAALVVGDNRQVIMEMPQASGKDFVGVVWRSGTGSQDFAVPMGFERPNPLLYRAEKVPIWFDEGRRLEAGRLHFYYNRWASVSWALLAWAAIAVLSIPVGLREKNRLVREYEVLLRLKSQESYAAVAAQVSHGIRSPLAALDSALKDAARLPEDTRGLIRSAVSRIRDIANDLIERNREIQKAGKASASSASLAGGGEPAAVELLSSLMDPLVTEKRLQFRSQAGVAIEGRLAAGSYGLFGKVQATEFKRMLSNLVNNAVESLGERGTVTVELVRADASALVRVQDDGNGIPPEILAKLGQKGETHGKPGGSGLGLFHARNCVESWGGRLEIQSEVGKGTTVTVSLPQAQPPEWFVSRLELTPGGTIVVLDDDASIHLVWQGRFDSLGVKEQGIEVLHFATPAELRGWVRDNSSPAADTLFLLDYEFLGLQETGLGLAEELVLGERSILVTSRFEEKNVLAECLRLKVRMIPKGMAGFVPVSIRGPLDRPAAGRPRQSGPDAVLLDDDALAQMTWKVAAQSKGLKFMGFRDPGELLAALDRIPKETPIYLDCELGEGLRGDAVAKDLHAKGFTNLYLATGHPPDTLPAMPWIRKVVGKDPPWG